jgi:hypothetical protein
LRNGTAEEGSVCEREEGEIKRMKERQRNKHKNIVKWDS